MQIPWVSIIPTHPCESNDVIQISWRNHEKYQGISSVNSLAPGRFEWNFI